MAAFRDMYRNSLSEVYGYILGQVGGNRALAEDITSETFLSALRHHAERPREPVSIAWLKTVARRRTIDHWRNQEAQGRRLQRLSSHRATEPSDAHVAAGDDQLEAIGVLRRLSDDHRLVLVLKYVDELAVSDIATHMGRTAKATEALLHRARQSFIAAWKEDHTHE